MIREPDLLAFAHVHPQTSDSVDFATQLPALPAGHYRVYGDIVHESGFAQTVSASVEIPTGIASLRGQGDPDDASYFATVPPNASRAVLDDGSVMKLESTGRDVVAGREAPLQFSITDKDGKPLALQPYIGMAGHAVVRRDDGAVFVHLHPSGTISMASQMAIVMRRPGDTISGLLGKRLAASEAAHPTLQEPLAGVVSFPYAFPKPGNYHMWVQVKHAGRILTGTFAIPVKPAPG
jgi:hypothetical protein